MKTARKILNELKTRHTHLNLIASAVSAKIRPDLKISLIEEVELKKILDEVHLCNHKDSTFEFKAMQIATWLNGFIGAYEHGD